MVFQLQNVRVELRIVIMKLRKLIFFAVTALMLSSLQCLYAHDAAFPLPSNKINEYPFNMVGKVSSGDIFSGSGTAISQKVVLAAAHSFFDEEILDWEPGPFKWNRQHSPSNRLFEMSSRSYRYFSDYAEATRRFLPDDESHSWEQFNLDVICLIFYNDVANGGYAGLGRNRITDYSDKMIVGYPQLNYGYYDSRRHTMHSTSLNGSRAKYTLVNYSDRLGNKRRAYWTEDLSTGPGNSGGPVFGRVNFSTGTDWGVVGIAVAGFTGESSTAVGIDNDVYDLIKEAESASGGSTPRDDHGDTRGTATKVELNRSVSGNLETAGDIDYFRFSLRDEGTTTISTTGSTDTLGTLRNNSGNYIISNDDSGQRENFSIKRSLTPGTFYISVSHALSQGTGTYSLRVNFVEKITYPDLAVDSVRVNKTSVKSGDIVQVTLKRSNKGDKNSPVFNHGIYLSRDRTITTSDRSLANLRATSMNAGASRTFSQLVTIPKNTTPGTYYIGYIVDTGKKIREKSETNNTGYTAITVVKPSVPDLAVDFVGVDKRSVKAGDSILVDCQRSNKGNERSSAFDHGIYLSKDRTINSRDKQLLKLGRISMGAGVLINSSYKVTIPKDTTPGIYYVGYILDIGDIIRETNESNNTGSTQIEVVKPASDLILEGSGVIAGRNIRHSNGHIFDQILLTGKYIKLQAKPNQITRVSFLDINGDIIQMEFSGEGTFAVTLDPATYRPPAYPSRYNQLTKYVTGKPSVVIEGANKYTFFSIFTVGKINAVNHSIFPAGQTYDAMADVKLVEVINSTGFGGLQFSNVLFSGNTGKVGIDAKDVPISIRMTVYDIDARGSATPYLLFGKGSFTIAAPYPGLRITGGDLYQSNRAKIVAISEAENPIFQGNVRSDGKELRAQSMRGSFDFIDRQVVSLIPERFDDIGYNFEFDDYFWAFYFTGNTTSGTFEIYLGDIVDGEYNVMIISGHYTGRVDFNNSNKLRLTLVGVEMEFWIDFELIFTASLTEAQELFDSIADILGEVAVLPQRVEIEMDFVSFISGTFKITIDYGPDYELYVNHGVFLKI